MKPYTEAKISRQSTCRHWQSVSDPRDGGEEGQFSWRFSISRSALVYGAGEIIMYRSSNRIFILTSDQVEVNVDNQCARDSLLLSKVRSIS